MIKRALLNYPIGKNHWSADSGQSQVPAAMVDVECDG